VDLATTEKLAAKISGTGILPVCPPNETHTQDAYTTTLLVAESGIHTRADVERLKRCGAGAILVGESLMRDDDIGTKLRDLIG
jgi:indole-3-glycerol phosphate synthase